MRFFAEALGTIAVETKFNRIGAEAINASPAMNEVADIMMDVMRKNFTGQGRRGGGSWKRDTPAWVARKVRLGLDPRIMIATGALMNSMSKRRDKNQTLYIRRDQVRISSKLPYAARQNRERRFNYFLRADVDEMRRVIRRHLMKVWKAQL